MKILKIDHLLIPWLKNNWHAVYDNMPLDLRKLRIHRLYSLCSAATGMLFLESISKTWTIYRLTLRTVELALDAIIMIFILQW